MNTITVHALRDLIDRGESPLIVDVRTPAEFAAGHVASAINVPLADLIAGRGRLPDAAGEEEVVVYCGRGPRAWVASPALRRLGAKRVVYLKGHWTAWRRAGQPVE